MGFAASGYMEAIINQQENMISMDTLKAGEDFEKDINDIIGIIDGVERDNNQIKLSH